MKSILFTLFSSLLLGLLFGSTPSAYAGPSASLTSYFAVSQALADDSLPTTKEAAKDLAKNAHAEGKAIVEKLALAVAGSNSIEDAREKFKPLSREMIQESSSKGGYYVMTCSMAKAEWLQANPVITNPYMGKKMLRCGALKEQTKPLSE